MSVLLFKTKCTETDTQVPITFTRCCCIQCNISTHNRHNACLGLHNPSAVFLGICRLPTGFLQQRTFIYCFIYFNNWHTFTSYQVQSVRSIVEEQLSDTVMDVRAVRWDALGSRDASSRHATMEIIHQEVMKRIENIGPIPDTHSSGLSGVNVCPASDLNPLMAHVLMLSKRCPYEDVREKCLCLLQRVQVSTKLLWR